MDLIQSTIRRQHKENKGREIIISESVISEGEIKTRDSPRTKNNYGDLLNDKTMGFKNKYKKS